MRAEEGTGSSGSLESGQATREEEWSCRGRSRFLYSCHLFLICSPELKLGVSSILKQQFKDGYREGLMLRRPEQNEAQACTVAEATPDESKLVHTVYSDTKMKTS